MRHGRQMSRIVCGCGVNDATYTTQKFVNRKLVWVCPFYQKWVSMLKRCYSDKLQNRYPTYRGCTVCEEWLTFSNFKSWMEQQDWENKHLDKDLLVRGNKVYSPDTCVFLTKEVNSFLTDSKSSRGEFPIGVSFHKGTGKYRARCSNPYSKSSYLGMYDDPKSAHLVWVNKKKEIASLLAKEEENYNIREPLLNIDWEQ